MRTDTYKMVWDPLVRLTHWLVAGIVVANLWLLESGNAPHRWLGYLACGAIGVRLIWGFVGSPHARFSDWLPTPQRLTRYLGLLIKGREPRMLGHNPAGAVMMLTLWALVTALGVTGYLMGTDMLFGESWLEALHEGIANTLIAAVVLHVCGALLESWRHRENLVRSMVTGRKRLD
jgi:cytochrome b